VSAFILTTKTLNIINHPPPLLLSNDYSECHGVSNWKGEGVRLREGKGGEIRMKFPERAGQISVLN